MKVIIDNSDYYYEEDPSSELGERYEVEHFYKLILDEVLNDIVS